MTPPFLINCLREAGAFDEAQEKNERLCRASNEFDMPIEPDDPALTKDLAPLPPSLVSPNATAGGRAVKRKCQMDVNFPSPRLGSAAPAGLLRPESHTKPSYQAVTETGAGSKGSMKRAHAAEGDVNHQEEPAPKASHDRPRTRFHPSAGHAGISRRKAQIGLQPNSTIVHHTALRTSSPDARTTSRAVRPVPGTNPSCHEQPAYWSTGPGFNPLRHALNSGKEMVHLAPVAPCSQTEAHAEGPYYVCASCRIAAEKHKTKHFGNLGQHSRSLPLCDECALYNVTMMGNPEQVGIGQLKRYGYRTY
ncbi:MAG: hypothetical protein Q9173_001083 [Seirophora scorigena]